MLFLAAIVCGTTTAIVNAEKLEQKNEYILEFNSMDDTTAFTQEHTKSIHVRYTYNSELLTGTAVEFKDDAVAEKLLKHPNIKRSWPIHHRAHLHAPVPDFQNSDSDSNEAQVSENDTTVTTFAPQKANTIPLLTQAYTKFRDLKSNGSGVKIGIIDTGVDYTHPALGGCFGKGCKFAYGYDLVGNNYNGSTSSIEESNDPIDNCPANSTSATGHGTFVSGIIGAQDLVYNWTGVAPGATLGMWKVYGCNYAGSPNDVILKAMEMAYKAGMDVISISLGISGGWQEDVLSVMADRLVSKGIHVITASGNSGTSGIFLTASPASGKNVIAVGSTMNAHVPGYILKLIPSNKKKDTIDITYRTFVNTALTLNATLPIIPTGKEFNQENDACNNLGDSDKYNNTIVLIHQGGHCDTLTKVKHARSAGAKAVVLYTDTRNATTSFETLSNAVLPIAFVNNDDGEIIFKTAHHYSNTKQALKAQFTNTLVAMEAPENEADSISSFSTLGPTNELQLKPELVAVGGNVFSTVPRYQGSYRFASGTSFSAPYVSANVALFLSNCHQSKQSPDLVKNVLMNFASPVKGPISASHYGDSPIRQGAGVVDVAQAIHGFEQFHVSPAKLSLNDTAHSHFLEHQEITIHNHAKTTLTFNISHQPSLTATGYALNQNHPSYTPVEPIGLYAGNQSSVATLQFDKTSLVISAGEAAKVRVHIKPPSKTFSLQDHVLYGGYIMISTTNTDAKAYVPYFGMIGNMIDLPILDRSNKPSPAAPYQFPAIGLTNGNSTVKDGSIGHFNMTYYPDLKLATGGPYILARLLTGTALLQVQIMDKENQHIGDVPMTESRRYMMRNTLGITEYSTSFYSWYWSGEYTPKNSSSSSSAEPKLLPSGEYRLKMRALKVFGSVENDHDFDTWTSARLKLEINTK
ncbi:subtilisin-like serine protease PR1C [Mucor ambiguus]|uniref:Subtilisin-like serine protease PR1C n=1 Tax=Mucor ambiguus TaxID=91626 RepID=A0A0C9LV29_9FUNG|nr:subtilisin-like serine protease PR1C [Mucor ambiguus]